MSQLTRRLLPLLASVSAAGLVVAQTSPEPTWVERQEPPPASFSTHQLVEFKVSTYSELRYGIDPKTVALGTDGVVRYVLVAQSPSAQNILYEGLRCATGEAKTYARWIPDGSGHWQPLAEAEWRPLVGNSASRPAHILAREGFCDGKMPNGDVSRMLRELRYGKPPLK